MSEAGNPFNDQPTVRLLDQAGAPLRLVGQRDAARLMRGCMAELLFVTPPAVRLTVPTPECQAALSEPPDEASAPRRPSSGSSSSPAAQVTPATIIT